jgi:hypothetical protein
VLNLEIHEDFHANKYSHKYTSQQITKDVFRLIQLYTVLTLETWNGHDVRRPSTTFSCFYNYLFCILMTSSTSCCQFDGSKESIILCYYKDQLVNAVQGYRRCLQWESYGTRKHKRQSYCWLKQVVHIVTTALFRCTIHLEDLPSSGEKSGNGPCLEFFQFLVS